MPSASAKAGSSQPERRRELARVFDIMLLLLKVLRIAAELSQTGWQPPVRAAARQLVRHRYTDPRGVCEPSFAPMTIFGRAAGRGLLGQCGAFASSQSYFSVSASQPA